MRTGEVRVRRNGGGVETESERLFRQFCDESGLVCVPIPCASHRTPDYSVTCSGTRVVCEVKQLQQSQREKAALQEAFSTGSAAAYFPGNRLRQKLKKISPQLKAEAGCGTPTILVVYDNGPFGTDLDHETVLQAMFGDIGYPIQFVEGSASKPVAGEPRFGGNRGLTPVHNTSVSALAALERHDGRLRLRVYHNPFAAVPLNPDILPADAVVQRVLPGDASVSL